MMGDRDCDLLDDRKNQILMCGEGMTIIVL